MTRAHITKERTTPLWAALGAPLLGVPLMVGLLALAGPGTRPNAGEPGGEPGGEPDVGVAVEAPAQEPIPGGRGAEGARATRPLPCE